MPRPDPNKRAGLRENVSAIQKAIDAHVMKRMPSDFQRMHKPKPKPKANPKP